jgi:hypothetical protein
MSFSAPGWSSTTRESVTDDVANASGSARSALMRPGDDVDARAAAVREHEVDAGGARQLGDADIESSTSRGATIMRSASSSTMTSRYG